MADTRGIRWAATGATLYATLREAATLKMWDESAVETEPESRLVTYDPADWELYVIAMEETPASGRLWPFEMPADVPGTMTNIRRYDLEVYQQSGGDPLISDTRIYNETVYWTGTDLLTEAEYSAQVVENTLAGGLDDGVSQPSPGAM